MDPFSPTQQPDEGYSEDPLAPTVPHSLSAELATLRSPAELPAWLARHATVLPLSVKRGKSSGARSPDQRFLRRHEDLLLTLTWLQTSL